MFGGGVLVALGVAWALVVRGPSEPPTVVVVESSPKANPVAVAPKAVADAEPSKKPEPVARSGQAWASARIYPIGVDVDGDGREDVIGPTVRTEGANTNMYVTAFDGASLQPKWSIGPFGTVTRAVESSVAVVAAGKRLVVLDAKGDAHLHELSDGKLVVDFPFREDNRGMCGPPNGEPQVLVRVGRGDFVIDTKLAKGSAAPPPSWCAGGKYMRRRPSESFNNYGGKQADYLRDIGYTADRFRTLRPPPKTSLDFALADGPVVVGVAHGKGTHERSLVGFDASGESLYSAAASELGVPPAGDHFPFDLARGLFVLVGATSVVAVDGATGVKRWETPWDRAKDAGVLSLAKDAVWITFRSGARAGVAGFSLATGALLGATD